MGYTLDFHIAPLCTYYDIKASWGSGLIKLILHTLITEKTITWRLSRQTFFL